MIIKYSKNWLPQAAVEQLGLLPLQHRPGPGVGVEAADEVVDLLGALVEVDPANLRLVEVCVVGGAHLRLLDPHSRLLGDHLDRLSHGLHSLGVHEVVVEAVHGVVDGDVALPGEEKVPGVQTVVRVEDGETSLGVSLYQSPGDGAGSSVAGQQGGVETDGPGTQETMYIAM